MKIYLEIEGRVCDVCEFANAQEAMQTGLSMIKKGVYQEGDILVVRVFDDNTKRVIDMPKLPKGTNRP